MRVRQLAASRVASIASLLVVGSLYFGTGAALGQPVEVCDSQDEPQTSCNLPEMVAPGGAAKFTFYTTSTYAGTVAQEFAFNSATFDIDRPPYDPADPGDEDTEEFGPNENLATGSNEVGSNGVIDPPIGDNSFQISVVLGGAHGQQIDAPPEPTILKVGPGELYPTIQSAIDAARSGDTVVVKPKPGGYTGAGNKELDFKNRAIRVRGEHDPTDPSVVDPTIIDLEGSGRAFHFKRGEGSGSIVEYFKIVNGDVTAGNGLGGAILVETSQFTAVAAPRILSCIFEDNAADLGGAIYALGSSPTVDNSIFEDNVANEGGAIFGEQSVLEVTRSSFLNNGRTTIPATVGGAVLNGADSSLRVENTEFINSAPAVVMDSTVLNRGSAEIVNSTFYAPVDDGLLVDDASGSTTTVTNSILWRDISTGDVFPAAPAGTLNIVHSDVQGGVVANGNIAIDPEFISKATLDLRLMDDSPARDEGTLIPGMFTDRRGSLRPVDAFDMGAFEYSDVAGGGDPDGVTNAFENVMVMGTDIVTEYPYEVRWELKDPFPCDPRVENQQYTAHLALVGEYGQRMELLDVNLSVPDCGTPVDVQSSTVAFQPEHVGDNWRLRVEVADDPNQAAESAPFDIALLVEQQWTIGAPIGTPTMAQADFPNGTAQGPDIQGPASHYFWHTEGTTLYAAGPTDSTWVVWFDADGKDVATRGVNVWPQDEDLQVHVAESQPVPLLPPGNGFESVVLRYTGSADAALSPAPEPEFSASQPGRSTLVYRESDLDQPPQFELVETVLWNDPAHLAELGATIGEEITFDEHDPLCANGFPLREAAPYAVNMNFDVPTVVFDRSQRMGTLIPVNKDVSPGDPSDDLIVAWYQVGVFGACWPYSPARYTPTWPELTALGDKIIVARQNGTGPIDPAMYPDFDIYFQNDPSLAGFNPNDEHATKESIDGGTTIFARRDDLGSEQTSEPYVLMSHRDPVDGSPRIRVFKVLGQEAPYLFEDWPHEGPESDPYQIVAAGWTGVASNPIPAPLPLFLEPVRQENVAVDGPFFEDRTGAHWAIAAGDNGGDATITMRYFYTAQPDFFFPQGGVNPGDAVPLLDGATPGTPIDITYTVRWPESVNTMPIGETLLGAMGGLPTIITQCSVDIEYQQSLALSGMKSVDLIDPLTARGVHLAAVPSGVEVDNQGGVVRFLDLSLALQARLSFNPLTSQLELAGVIDDPVSPSYHYLNVMSLRDQAELQALSAEPAWQLAVDMLYEATKDPIVILDSDVDDYEALAVSSGFAQGTGYVTLVMQNSGDCDPQSISLEIFQVVPDLSPGTIDVLKPSCPFDEKLTLRHSGDFGGRPDDYDFEWYYLEAEDGSTPAVDFDTEDWQLFSTGENGFGANDITIKGSGLFTLSDHWFVTRYRYTPAGLPWSDTWSDYTPPQLAEGWIKRVVGQVNPFDPRGATCGSCELKGTEDTFFSYKEPSTLVSMIGQAGRRWEGNVPLNCQNLDAFGLLEIYQTVLNRGRAFSIEGGVNHGPTNQALLLVASRVADLYMLLGNEAYADASDPTIGFTTDGAAGSAAPKMFCFQDQVPSLLQEELQLLRGKDEMDPGPTYNRMTWNFTGGSGQLAYVNNYEVDDITEARAAFPQAHGDAWGHSLTALRTYYDLFRHESFSWVPRGEQVLVGGSAERVDFQDEQNFASIAAAKARAGAEIASLTYRDNYVDNPTGQWQGYRDTDTDRAWGVSEWSIRSGQAAYLDWVAGNALLPELDQENTGIQRIDRRTVSALTEVASQLLRIQSQQDDVDIGLNPLGIAKDAIPFDISPTDVDAGQTHFEQIYNRAVVGLNNAITVFNHANESSQLLRKQQDTIEDFERTVEDREADFNNRLIEIYGYPYFDDIGAGGYYPAGYDGPDYRHFSYVDPSPLLGDEESEVDEFVVSVTDYLEVSSEGEAQQTTEDVTFHLSRNGLGLVKPPTWLFGRRAPGEIQLARSDLLQTKARFERALTDYDNLLQQIDDEVQLLQSQFNLNESEITIQYGIQGAQQQLNDAIRESRRRQLEYRTVGRMASLVANSLAEALPKTMGFIAGLANGVIADWTSSIRSAIMLAGTITNEVMSQKADSESLNELAVSQAKEMVQSQGNLVLTSLRNEFAIEQRLAQLAQIIRSEATLRLDLYVMEETVRQSAGRYQQTLARGERLLQDRTRFRQQVAEDVTDFRYKDMAFRVFRNDALQKYRAQFDLAARNVYLAAKAYDYDTGLLNTNNSAGEQFMTSLVKERTIGEINEGSPLTGSGLADPMARMSLNFQTLKSQMGFNNPQIEETRFSLRRELFRIRNGPGSSGTWRRALQASWVDNLWDLSEFRRYCAPFAPEEVTGPTPGLVVPFTTNITFNLNFFGFPLGPNDSAYDSSRFSTRIRGVGVWFENYNTAQLSNTPRIYLVPVGEDIIRSPSPTSFDTRSFAVVEQVLPTPFPIDAATLENNRDWIPFVDAEQGGGFELRRHTRFRAYHDSGAGWESEIVNDTRLIGRSVWNTRWMLIIPGASLDFLPAQGLEAFIDNVTDIKFIFETYSYAGGAALSQGDAEQE